MKIDKLEVAAALTPGVLLALVGGAVFGAVAATLDPAERAALGAMLAPRGALFFLGWMLPRKGDWKTRSAPRARMTRCPGCSSWTASCSMIESIAIVPEWFATISARPAGGRCPRPRVASSKSARAWPR